MSSIPSFKWKDYPWLWFAAYTLSFGLLSNGVWPLGLKITILILGVLFPTGLAFFAKRPQEEKGIGFLRTEILPSLDRFPPWGIVLFVSVLGFTRLAMIGRSAWWPGGDESHNIFQLPFWLEHFHWSPFVDTSQIPSPMVYAALFLAHITHDPWVSAQSISALISLLTVLLATWAASTYFSRSNAFLVFLLFSFSYWPLLIAWTFLQGITTPLWEVLFLFLLVQTDRANHPNAKRLLYLLLGLVIGTSPFTFFSWPVFFLWSLSVVLWMAWEKRLTGQVALLILGVTLTFQPFLWAALDGTYGNYFLEIGGKGQTISWSEHARIFADYFISLGWNDVSGTWAPQAGGYLNPLLMAAFLIGLIGLLRSGRSPFLTAYRAAFILFLLPGLLSRDFEGHRILFFLPLALWTSAVGIQQLLRALSVSRRVTALGLLLVLSLIYDLTRLQNPLTQLFHPQPSGNEQQVAYNALRSLSRTAGPGLIFGECVPYTVDYSLSCASYPFNAAWNPDLSPEKANWAAIFTVDIFKEDLQRTFPDLRWVPLPGISRHVLCVLPLTSKDRKRILDWLPFNRFWMDLNYQFVDNPSGHSRDFLLGQLASEYPSVPSDPFLQTCFFEKLLYLYSAEKTFQPEKNVYDYERLKDLFKDSYQRGYSNPSVTWQYARLLQLENHAPEAFAFLRRSNLAPP